MTGEKPKLEPLDDDAREAVREVAARLMAAFPWHRSADGREYWSDVWQRLCRIHNTGR